MTLETMISSILARLDAFADKPRILITIDGPCGSGKTTLAARLAEALTAPVVHLDDFSIPHAQKMPERLAIPGGNLDAERFGQEVLHPWLERGTASYRPYDCHADGFAEVVHVPECRVLIVEGSYATLPDIAKHADLHVFLRISPELQQKRLRQRVGAERIQHFNARWIPLEQAYFAAYSLPDERCLCLDAQEETEV